MDESSAADFLAEFAEAARKHRAYTETGDARRINRAAERIEAAYRGLLALGDQGRTALVRLTQSEDLSVATMAATYGMHYAPEEARQALDRGAKDRGIVGLEACYALRRFEDGTWRTPF